jgi:AcrR family transcriptional regulator
MPVIYEKGRAPMDQARLLSQPAPALPAPGRRERRRRENRERLFHAALQLFAQRGLLSTTVEDITQAADLGKGTFFNYFPTKEHVLTVFAEMQLAKVEAALEEMKLQGQPLRGILRRLMLALAHEPGRSHTLARSMVLALCSSEPLRNVMLAHMAAGRKLLARMFRLAQQRGELPASQQPMELARVFQQTFFGALVLWSLHGDSELGAWLNPAFELFWAGATAGSSKKGKTRGAL